MKLLITVLTILSLTACKNTNVEEFGPDSEIAKYTLSYNINGATSGTTPSAVMVDDGSRLVVNNGVGLSRSGFTFAGWNTNANGAGVDYLAGSTLVINSDIILYAKWSQVPINVNAMNITVGNRVFTATFVDNATVTAFKAMLPLTLNMSDFNSNEKVCSISNNLPTSASNPRKIQIGDIMLYGSSSLVLFYETFSTSYSYTRIGQVDDVSGFKSALGTGNIIVKFELK